MVKVVKELAAVFDVAEAVGKCVEKCGNKAVAVKLLFAMLKRNGEEIENKCILNLIKHYIMGELEVGGEDEYVVWMCLLFIRRFHRILPNDWIAVNYQ